METDSCGSHTPSQIPLLGVQTRHASKSIISRWRHIRQYLWRINIPHILCVLHSFRTRSFKQIICLCYVSIWICFCGKRRNGNTTEFPEQSSIHALGTPAIFAVLSLALEPQVQTWPQTSQATYEYVKFIVCRKRACIMADNLGNQRDPLQIMSDLQATMLIGQGRNLQFRVANPQP